MREIRTSGVTREGVAGLQTRPLYSTVKNAIDEAKTVDEAREVHVVSIAPL
jgi:hypothetical protein